MILAHDAGLFSLEATLQKLFAAAFTDGKGASWDAQGERLKGALVEWDCQDVLGVPPPATGHAGRNFSGVSGRRR